MVYQKQEVLESNCKGCGERKEELLKYSSFYFLYFEINRSSTIIYWCVNAFKNSITTKNHIEQRFHNGVGVDQTTKFFFYCFLQKKRRQEIKKGLSVSHQQQDYLGPPHHSCTTHPSPMIQSKARSSTVRLIWVHSQHLLQIYCKLKTWKQVLKMGLE